MVSMTITPRTTRMILRAALRVLFWLALISVGYCAGKVAEQPRLPPGEEVASVDDVRQAALACAVFRHEMRAVRYGLVAVDARMDSLRAADLYMSNAAVRLAGETGASTAGAP